jgi:hypothetical protein
MEDKLTADVADVREETTEDKGIQLEIPLPVRGESYWTLDMNSIPYKRKCIPDLTDFYNINYSFVFRDKREAELNADYHRGHIKAVLDTYARLNKELADRKEKS